MDDKIIISPDDIEVIDAEGYSYEVVEQFDKVPEVAKNLVKGAKATFSRIEKMLYTAPGFSKFFFCRTSSLFRSLLSPLDNTVQK